MPKTTHINPSGSLSVTPISITQFIARMSADQQSEIHSKIVAALVELKELTPDAVDTAMSGRLSDIEDLIDLRELTLIKIA